ncbi:hypothetical protein [uncultured Nostoc sp.]|uniref:hypothetical protein n=1 Tax=uncultured Nostoc sp. TaxID=340711 RepID=UPI0035CC837B
MTTRDGKEVGFILLTKDLYQSEEYYKWAGLFHSLQKKKIPSPESKKKRAYEGTIKEIAAKEDQKDKLPHDKPKFTP